MTKNRITVFLLIPVRRLISHIETCSRKYQRLILAKVPTVITILFSPVYFLGKGIVKAGQLSTKITTLNALRSSPTTPKRSISPLT